jgi:hypothetical protein
MADAEPKKTMTVYGLVNAIDEFISDNSRSSDVTLRWFTKFMEGPQRVARQVRSGGLDDEFAAAVAMHRLAEIDAEKHKRQSEIAELDREAAKLRVA